MPNSQYSSPANNEEENAAEIEKLLRQSAPDLPMVLRNRTLAHCKARAIAKQQRQKRLQWQLTWAVFGILSVQCLTLSVVNAQNTQLIAGNTKNSTPPLFASLSFSEVSQLWHQRSRQLALLMQSSALS